MNKSTGPTQQRLIQHFGELGYALGQMKGSAQIFPNDGWGTILPAAAQSSTSIDFDVRPIVFNVPERASDRECKLFVVVEGRLSLHRDVFEKSGEYETNTFATQVAYFRRTKTHLEHVFGAHYDIEPLGHGHPIFHFQFKSFAGMHVHVRKHFSEVNLPLLDKVDGVLRTVRTPSAHMDVFSLFIQICADHLLHKNSGSQEIDAFNGLLEQSSFLTGAGPQQHRLRGTSSRSCYRGRHWYP